MPHETGAYTIGRPILRPVSEHVFDFKTDPQHPKPRLPADPTRRAARLRQRPPFRGQSGRQKHASKFDPSMAVPGLGPFVALPAVKNTCFHILSLQAYHAEQMIDTVFPAVKPDYCGTEMHHRFCSEEGL